MALLFVKTLAELISGSHTAAYLRRLDHTQWLDFEELHELQLARLRRLVQFVHANVKPYRTLFDEHGVPSRISSFEEFRRFPAHEGLRAQRPPVRSRLARGRRRGAKHPSRRLRRARLDRQRAAIEQAARLRAHRWFGVEPGAKTISIEGGPTGIGRRSLLQGLLGSLTRSLRLSPFEITKESLPFYVKAIARFNPTAISGPPSALHLLAHALEPSWWQPGSTLKAIFTVKEPLFDFQRKTIQALFDCPVSAEYSSPTTGLVANECPEGALHIFAEGVYVEIIEPDAEGVGEIAVTNLDALASPLLRHRTGDFGSLETASCACGRSLPRLRLSHARPNDCIVTPRGQVLRATSVIDVLSRVPGVWTFKVVQESLRHVVVQVVPLTTFLASDHCSLVGQLRLLLGHEVKVEVIRKPLISPTSSGTFRYVESNVKSHRPDFTTPPSVKVVE